MTKYENRNKVYATSTQLSAYRYINGVLCVNGVPASQELQDLQDSLFEPIEKFVELQQ